MYMKDTSLGESEFKLMELVWDRAPLSSGELSDICEAMYGWKKTTVYTMIKRLSDKGFIENKKATITYLVGREEIQGRQSEELVTKNFKGSLPMFVNSFLRNKNLSKEDAARLIDMIEQHTEE